MAYPKNGKEAVDGTLRGGNSYFDLEQWAIEFFDNVDQLSNDSDKRIAAGVLESMQRYRDRVSDETALRAELTGLTGAVTVLVIQTRSANVSAAATVSRTSNYYAGTSPDHRSLTLLDSPAQARFAALEKSPAAAG